MANRRLHLQPTSKNYCKTKTMALCDLHVVYTQNKNAANVGLTPLTFMIHNKSKHQWNIPKNPRKWVNNLYRKMKNSQILKWQKVIWVYYFDSETASLNNVRETLPGNGTMQYLIFLKWLSNICRNTVFTESFEYRQLNLCFQNINLT